MFAGLCNLQEILLGQNQISHIEEGAFDSLVSLTYLHLYKNRLTTMNPDIFANVPRHPLVLHLSSTPGTNQWNCSSLCWLKHEELHGTVKWHDGSVPTCADPVNWLLLPCGVQG